MSTVMLGSLAPMLGLTQEGRRVLASAGPVSDEYMLARDDVAVIMGPVGSGKTTASIKKALISAARIRPTGEASEASPHGHRRYVLGVFREKYDNLWKATIPSWQKVFPPDMPGSDWTGASPRAAQHVLRWRDDVGEIEMIVRFRAFSDTADPNDMLGNEFTDVYLNEINTLPESLFEALLGRIGRDPPAELIGRTGRVWGDCNAMSVTNWVYRDFFESPKPGYRLYRQPGGLEPGAENIAIVGRAYYEKMAMLNATRPWWVRRMVHNIPGVTQGTDLVYPKWVDHVHQVDELRPLPGLPIVVGVDGGLTPAAAYTQETADGQARVLAEIALERAGMAELARAMLALEARLFPDYEFATVCDPAMGAGEDTEDGSVRRALERHLKRKVRLAGTNNPELRWGAVRAKFDLALDAGRPGILVAKACKGLVRGFAETYHYRKTNGTNDLSSVQKTFDSHVHDALQYAALDWGTARARLSAARRADEIKAQRDKSRRAVSGGYNPFSRSYG